MNAMEQADCEHCSGTGVSVTELSGRHAAADVCDVCGGSGKARSDAALSGWASFWRLPEGTYFLSDSYKTEAECRASYSGSEIDGYIDLSKIPPEAIKPV